MGTSGGVSLQRLTHVYTLHRTHICTLNRKKIYELISSSCSSFISLVVKELLPSRNCISSPQWQATSVILIYLCKDPPCVPLGLLNQETSKNFTDLPSYSYVWRHVCIFSLHLCLSLCLSHQFQQVLAGFLQPDNLWECPPQAFLSVQFTIFSLETG